MGENHANRLPCPLLLAVCANSVSAAVSSVAPNQEEGPEREPYWHLFLDDHIITRSTGFRRVVRHPRPRGVVLPVDQPWEGLGVTPVYIGHRTGGGHEMYHRAHWPLQRGNRPPRYDHPPYTTLIAYAISDDGIHWEKPHLKLVDSPAEIDLNIWPPYPMTTGKTNLNNLLPCGHPRDMWQHGNVRDPAKQFTMSLNYGAPSNVSFASELPDMVNDPDWQSKYVDSGGYKPSNYNALEYWDDIHQEWVALRQTPNHTPTRVGGRYASPDLQN